MGQRSIVFYKVKYFIKIKALGTRSNKPQITPA